MATRRWPATDFLKRERHGHERIPQDFVGFRFLILWTEAWDARGVAAIDVLVSIAREEEPDASTDNDVFGKEGAVFDAETHIEAEFVADSIRVQGAFD